MDVPASPVKIMTGVITPIHTICWTELGLVKRIKALRYGRPLYSTIDRWLGLLSLTHRSVRALLPLVNVDLAFCFCAGLPLGGSWDLCFDILRGCYTNQWYNNSTVIFCGSLRSYFAEVYGYTCGSFQMSMSSRRLKFPRFCPLVSNWCEGLLRQDVKGEVRPQRNNSCELGHTSLTSGTVVTRPPSF